MSTFEFVLILFAIIVGLAITEILQGWADQLRAGRRFSGLQLAASAYLLAMSLRFLWMLWSGRSQVWDYLDYVLAAGQPLVLAIASRVVRLDLASDLDAEQQYLAKRRALFGVLALFPVLLVLRSLAIDPAEFANSPIGMAFMASSSAILFGIFVWLAWTPKRGHHRVGLAVLWIVNLLWSVFVQPSLSSPGAG